MLKYDIRTGAKRIKTKIDVTKSLMGLVALALPAVLFLSTGGALAASGYSLFGDAELVSPGNASPKAVQIRSDADPGFGGVRYDIPAGTTFADLGVLSTDFMVESDDLCVGGSPRFQVRVDTNGDNVGDANIFVYYGIDSASTPCVPGTWQNTTDLLEAGKLLDTSQLGGTFYHEYTLAVAAYGSYKVTGVNTVVDSSWAHPDSEQTVLIDNTNVDGTVYTYDQPQNKDECKKGGWMNLTDQNGDSFKNQGQCVSWTNGRGQ